MEWLIELLPDDVTLLQALILIGVAGFTSALTAAIGIGGGLILLAVMTTLFPVSVAIPVHGVLQLGSNAGRAILQWRHVDRSILLWIALGGLLGTVSGAQIIVEIAEAPLKIGVAIFVLLSVWGPKIKIPKPGAKTFFATGAVGAFLTLFFGATGPIVASVLGRTGLDRFTIVATHGGAMVIQHSFKIIAFGFLGFSYAQWLPVMVAALSFGFIGTKIGLKFLTKLPEQRFRDIFKITLTLIAFYLILAAARGI